MCLLLTQTPDVDLPDDLLRGVYTRNSDGVGVMWAEDDKLHYVKAIFSKAEDAIAFYREHTKGRTCAAHFRLTTHGETRPDNTHPYPVFGFDEEHEHPMLLMHNGVLHTGNAKDKARSDTYWYIEDYLRPLIQANPELVFSPVFQKVIESHIGTGNRFVIMDHKGQIATFNKHTGTEYAGAWFSNQYAWDAHKYLPKPDYPSYHKSSWTTNHMGKQGGTTVKRAPVKTLTSAKTTKTGGKNTVSKQQPLPLRVGYPAPREVVFALLEQLEQTGSKAYAETSFIQMEKLVKHNGLWNTEDFIKMLGDGRIDAETFLEGMKDPVRCEQIIDEVDAFKLAQWGY